MKIFAKLTSLPLIFILFTSCSGPNGKKGISKQSGGTVIGALAGGLVGSRFGSGEGQFLAAGAGALLGGFLGNTVGKSMDEQDKLLAERTSQRALEAAPSGTEIAWKNPDSGNYGYVTPTKTYKAKDGRYCREYTQKIIVGDKEQKAYGTACRQEDGQWQIVSSN